MRSNLDSKFIGLVAIALYNDKGAHKSMLKYVSPTTIAKATWHRKPSVRNRNETMLVTFGNPNGRERKTCKWMQRNGHAFPLDSVEAVPYPRKRSK